MIGSMYSAVSGLQAHQTKMDVIGNNIANVNTYGYKTNRATFADVFYSTRRAASQPNANQGGTNPSQIGYGAKVATIDVIHTRAGAATTNRPLDVYINGDGFIAVKTADGLAKYTRAGVLSIDTAGNLVDRNGNMVLGLPLDDTTGMPKLDKDGKANIQSMVPVKLDPTIEYTGIEISLNGEVVAMKPGPPTLTPAPNTGWMSGSQSVKADSLYSGEVVLTITRGTGTNYIAGTYNNASPAQGEINGVVLSTGPEPQINGKLIMEANPSSTQGAIDYTLSGFRPDGSSFSTTVTGGRTMVTPTLGGNDASNLPIANYTGSPLYTITDTAHPDVGKTVAYTGGTFYDDTGAALVSQPTMAQVVAQGIYAPLYPDSILFDSATALGQGSVTVAVSNDKNTAASNVVIVSGQRVELGSVIASSMDVTGYGYEKSGNRVDFAPVNVDLTSAKAGDPIPISMGDITFNIDPSTFGALRDGQVQNMTVGNVAAGTSTPVKLGQVGVMTFYNQDGLSQEGEDYYLETINSGEPKGYVPGRSGTGTLLAGALEMSNVDLSREFTEMIITERGFQANTRMVTVSDEMLQELINMKR